MKGRIFLIGSLHKTPELFLRNFIVDEVGTGNIAVLMNFSIINSNCRTAVDVQTAARHSLVCKNQTCPAVHFQFGNVFIIGIKFVTNCSINCQCSGIDRWCLGYIRMIPVGIGFSEIETASTSNVICAGVECHLQRSCIFRNRDAVQRQIHAGICIDTSAESSCGIMLSVTGTGCGVSGDYHGILRIIAG